MTMLSRELGNHIRLALWSVSNCGYCRMSGGAFVVVEVRKATLSKEGSQVEHGRTKLERGRMSRAMKASTGLPW